MANTKKRGGRAAAEAAYADMLAAARSLVGDVGAAHEAFVVAHTNAVTAQKTYEDARAAAIKAAAITNDQLDQMGYRRTPKLPAPPTGDNDGDRPAVKTTEHRPGGAGQPAAKTSTGGPVAPGATVNEVTANRASA
jgi:hypothetical protein